MAKLIPSGHTLGASVEGLDLSRPPSPGEFEIALKAPAQHGGLPAALRKKLEGKTVLHDFNKFWEMMRREKGSARPALTEAQRKAKPPVSHPIFLPHPITGRKALYANPGYSVRINELPQKESDAILEFLFEHQTQPKFQIGRAHV